MPHPNRAQSPAATHPRKRVAVVGAGVVGLTTGITLAREGYEVYVYAGRKGSEITSSVAAAFWYPYAVSGFHRSWATNTYFTLLGQSRDQARTGVHRQRALEYIDAADQDALRTYVDELWWQDLAGIDFKILNVPPHSRRFRFLHPDRFGDRQFAGAVEFYTLVVDMGTYLPYLEEMLLAAGGNIVCPFWVESLRKLAKEESFDAIVNCAGFAAEMFDDSRRDSGLKPVTGQVISVNAPSAQTLIFIHSGEFEYEPIYIVPRNVDATTGKPRDVILGGSYIPTAVSSAHASLPTADKQLNETIIRRCQLIEPALADMTINNSRVGFRPVANSIQLAETAQLQLPGGVPVFNNYGHGGGGVSLSWGCAAAIACDVKREIDD